MWVLGTEPSSSVTTEAPSHACDFIPLSLPVSSLHDRSWVWLNCTSSLEAGTCLMEQGMVLNRKGFLVFLYNLYLCLSIVCA